MDYRIDACPPWKGLQGDWEPGMGTRFFSFLCCEEEGFDDDLSLDEETCDEMELIFERRGAERSVKRRSEGAEEVDWIALDMGGLPCLSELRVVLVV
jgi:hypothetical protein